MKHDFYNAYGLTFASDCELPGLPAVAEGIPDVRISYGAVPRELDHPLDQGVRFQADHDRFLLQVDGVARYLVSAGKEIVVEPCSDADKHDVQTFLLGSVFGALLLQRGYLVLSGSAVAIGKQAIVFSGISGIGKSTLAAAFYKKGYKVLTEDLCAVRLSPDGVPEIIPGFPWLKLWSNTVKLIGEDVATLQRVRSKLEKYELPLQDRFCTATLPLYRLYNLKTHGFNRFDVEKTRGMDKVEILLQNSYRRRLLEGHKKVLHLQQCVAAAKAIEVFRLSRPQKGVSLDGLATYIEMDLGI